MAKDSTTLDTVWVKSSFSDTGAQCVECGVLDETTVAVRDSKNPAGPALLFSRGQFAGLVAGVKAGGFGL